MIKNDLTEWADKCMSYLSQIPQTLSEELTETSFFQTLSRKSIRETFPKHHLGFLQFRRHCLRNFENSQTLSDQSPKIMKL